MRKSRLILFLMVLLQCGPLYATDARSSSPDYRTANTLFASSRYQEALVLYQKLLVTPPHGVPISEIYTRLGDTYFKLEYYQNALAAYRAALMGQKESKRPETQYWIGFCCFLLHRDGEAVEEFLKIPEQYPDSGMWVGTAYYWAGRASKRMGRTDEAKVYFRKAAGNGRSTQGKFALKKAAAVKPRKPRAESRD
jgi:tetratricopeptide (TPR) repeat protein